MQRPWHERNPYEAQAGSGRPDWGPSRGLRALRRHLHRPPPARTFAAPLPARTARNSCSTCSAASGAQYERHYHGVQQRRVGTTCHQNDTAHPYWADNARAAAAPCKAQHKTAGCGGSSSRRSAPEEGAELDDDEHHAEDDAVQLVGRDEREHCRRGGLGSRGK